MCLLRRGDLARARVALLAKPLFAAVVQEPSAEPGRSATRRAHVFQVRQLDRHLLREHATLRILLAPANVLLRAVHALDNCLARRAIYFDHAAFLATVVARNHFDGITGS